MLDNWVGNTALQERVQRADPGAEIIVEAVRVVRSDIKDVRADWAAADSISEVTVLDDGGALLKGTVESFATGADAAEVQQPITDMDEVEPFFVQEVRWSLLGAGRVELTKLIARLDPDAGNTGSTSVTAWRAQLFRLASFTEDADENLEVVLEPLSRVVEVVHAGTTDLDVTFEFNPGSSPIRPGPPPKYDGEQLTPPVLTPVTYIFVWALTGEGASAGNVAWLGDTDAFEKVHADYTARVLKLDRAGTPATNRATGGMLIGGTFEDLRTNLGVARFDLQRFSYTLATVTFSGAGNRIDLGAAPTDQLEMRGTGQTFGDSTITYEVRIPGGAWIEYVDGDIIGQDNAAAGGKDLSGLAVRQDYDIRATLTPGGGGGDITPIVRQIGVVERELVDLKGVATVRQASWAVDPITLKGEVTEATVEIIRDGITDYRDAATELFATSFIGEIEFRFWIGHPTDIPRHRWMLKDSFLVDDYDPGGPAFTVTCLAHTERLKALIPAFIGNTREPKVYANSTLKAAYDDILSAQIGVPARLIGPGVEDTTTLVSNKIEEMDGKAAIDSLAELAGGGVITSQGRIKFVNMVVDEGNPHPSPVVAFDRGEVQIISASPGFRARIMEFFVPFNWDERKGPNGAFAGEIRAFHGDALTKLGQAHIDPPLRLNRATARWIPTIELATTVSKRVIGTLGNGLILVRFRTTYPHPYLEPGDVVAVATDRFVARDPIATGVRDLRGPLWLTGPLQEVGNVWGTEFTVWVQAYSAIKPGSVEITLTKFADPEILDVRADFRPDGSLRLRGNVNSDARSVRFISHPTEFQEDLPTLRAVAPVATDDEGYFDFEIDPAETYDLGDVAFLTGLAFENADGSGSEQEQLYKSEEPWHADAVTGALWVTIDIPTKTLDVFAIATGPIELFPVTLVIRQNDPEGAPIDLDGQGLTMHTFAASGDTIGPTGSGKTTEYSGLTDFALQKSGIEVFFGELVSVNGVVTPLVGAGDLDSLPGGSTTAEDYAAYPSLRNTYDDDVAEIVVTIPGGKSKTFTGLSGGGLVTYTVGDVLDDASTEAALTDGETRTGYKVTLYSAVSAEGLVLEIYDGPLHGINASEPNRLTITASGWSVLGTILSLKLYYYYFNISLGPDTQSIKVEFDPGTGVITYNYDTSGAERHELKLSDGSTGAAFVNSQPSFTITITPYAGLNATGDAGSPVEIVTGPSLESGSGTAAEAQDGTIISGNALKTIALFDIDSVDGEPRLILQAVHDFGTKSANFAVDAIDGGAQEGGISADVELTGISNLVGVEPFSIRVACGANILTLSGAAFEGPQLAFTGDCAISFVDFGTGKIVAMGADY